MLAMGKIKSPFKSIVILKSNYIHADVWFKKYMLVSELILICLVTYCNNIQTQQ